LIMLLAKQDTEDMGAKRGDTVRIMIDMSKGKGRECEGRPGSRTMKPTGDKCWLDTHPPHACQVK